MASPPKPWERAGAGGTSGAISSSSAMNNTSTTTSLDSSSSNPPSLPQRPSALNSVVNQTASNYSSYGAQNRPYGSSPYGYGAAGMNSYSSPYSGIGGYGSGIGGYGTMGSMYGGGMGAMGGYGGGMYGRMGGMGGMGGMYGGGMGGMPGDPNNPSLTQSFSQSTQATFQLIESIVGAFGGFAQMLESTYMATHSSFFAMVSVAEQFGTLRQTLGSVLGIFTIMRWFRTAIAKLTGRPPPASSKELTPAKFAAFTGKLPDGSPAPTPSKKPFIMFMVAVFGLPYLMGKLIKALARGQEDAEKARREANPQLYEEDAAMDPTKLEFCRVMYDFTPESNSNSVQGVDLAVKKGDFVAILSKTDPMGNPSEWWRCRARDGRMGYLPSPYLEQIQKRAQITIGSQSGSPPGSRAQTMTTNVSAPNSRTGTMTEKVPVSAMAPKVEGKLGDISVDSFQKGQFYS
ncbi:hypothetical protein Vi05172_g194 [Venturia inaequalis]|nr:hypothetical protein Vi05172_g194 [Venturia inaequalis]